MTPIFVDGRIYIPLHSWINPYLNFQLGYSIASNYTSSAKVYGSAADFDFINHNGPFAGLGSGVKLKLSKGFLINVGTGFSVQTINKLNLYNPDNYTQPVAHRINLSIAHIFGHSKD